jgi:hypothetical protein
VGLTVDNIIVEMDPAGSFAAAGGMLRANDKIVRIDNEWLGSRMLKDVVRPKPDHAVTVIFARERTQPPHPREKGAVPLPALSTSLRLKEYALKVARSDGNIGFTLDPTNVIIAVDPLADAANRLRCAAAGGARPCARPGLAAARERERERERERAGEKGTRG